jgi:hypothetical protein
MEWQDISTAPKDDTRILAYFKGYGWCTARRVTFTNINGKTYDYWVNDPDNSYEECYFSGYETPTHWMPLPKPPTE